MADSALKGEELQKEAELHQHHGLEPALLISESSEHAKNLPVAQKEQHLLKELGLSVPDLLGVAGCPEDKVPQQPQHDQQGPQSGPSQNRPAHLRAQLVLGRARLAGMKGLKHCCQLLSMSRRFLYASGAEYKTNYLCICNSGI